MSILLSQQAMLFNRGFKSYGDVEKADNSEQKANVAALTPLAVVETTEKLNSKDSAAKNNTDEVKETTEPKEETKSQNEAPQLNSLLSPGIPAIRMSTTLTEKSFSDDGSCQFLPGGKPGCTRHNHVRKAVKLTMSEKVVSSSSNTQPLVLSAQNILPSDQDKPPVEKNTDKANPEVMAQVRFVSEHIRYTTGV